VATFPAGIKIFTTRVDLLDIVLAGHVNEIYEEIVAVQQVLGVNPGASAARATTYGTVDARLEALESGYAQTGHTHASALSNTVFDSAGDLIVGTGNDAFGRLARGSAQQVLRVNAAGTGLEYFTLAGASTAFVPNTIFDDTGDLVVGTGNDVYARLPRGSAAQYLRVNAAGTGLEYGALPSGNSLKTVRIPHTWHIPGEVKVASGDIDYIMGFVVPDQFGAGSGTTLAGVRAKLNSGTSVVVGIYRNGNLIYNFTVTTAMTNPAGAATVFFGGDLITIIVSNPIGSPRNLMVSAQFDYTS